MFRRILYLGYYIRELDRDKFSRFVTHVTSVYKISKLKLYSDLLYSSLKYNISLNEYFLFHFYKSDAQVRNTYAGTGFMYEYQLQMNPKKSRQVLEDKLKFLKVYSDFVNHDYASIDELQQKSITERLL